MALADTLAHLQQIFTGIATNIRNNWASPDDIGTDTQTAIDLPRALDAGKMTPEDMETLTESMYDVQLGKADASSILSGNSAYVKGGVLVHGNMPVVNVPLIVYPTAYGGTYPPSGGAFYKFGLQIPAEPNFIPQNIRAGVPIWGVEGTAAGDVTIPITANMVSVFSTDTGYYITLPEAASEIVNLSFSLSNHGNWIVGGKSGNQAWKFAKDETSGGLSFASAAMWLSADGTVVSLYSSLSSATALFGGSLSGYITYTPATATTT